MNSLLTSKQPIFQLGPQISSQTLIFRSFHHKNPSFIYFPQEKHSLNTKVLVSCSASAYNGWDSQSGDKSLHSGDSNLVQSFLVSLGINNKKFLLVYFLGFICALTISRVKVSSIIAFPSCVLVFGVGFFVGFLNKGQIRWNPSKKMAKDLSFKQFGEKFRDLINDCNVKIVGLRNDVRKAVDCKKISCDDLESILKGLESIDLSTIDIESLVNDKKKKEVGENGFNIAQFVVSLFQEKPNHSKLKDNSKKTSMNMEVNERNQRNILSSPVEDRRVDSLLNSYEEDNDGEMYDSPSRTRYKDQSFTFSSRRMNEVEDQENIITGKTRRFDSKYQKRKSYNMKHQEFSWGSKEVETGRSRSYDGFFESMDLDASVNWQDQETERFESMEESEHHQQWGSSHDSEPSFDDTESIPLSEDIEFNRCLSEAKSLIQEAKERVTTQLRDDNGSENVLYRSAKLLSRAVNIRPMSLIAIGLLGNTYLLHGELKLRISRELRAVLAKNDRKSDDEWDEDVGNVGRREKIVSLLVKVCEECEELLVEAGRKYKLALSIDGNDMRALYNWGLALFFRAQLIADVGPGGARDADKVFMAAIDKFDAMISRSNLYAPDALLRWGAALEQRSRLRPRKSKEKVKLLQQARRLYKDALDMDSDNIQVKDALSSCSSQLKHWYDY